MQVQSVSKYRAVAYPDKDSVSSDPDLLRSIPERWKRNAAACAALAATSAMLLSCSADDTGNTASATSTAITASPTPTIAPTPSPTPSPAPAPVPAIPLFKHGIGRGSFGCVSVAPPAFLSEAEALAVINEVAAADGLAFTQTTMEISGVSLPVTDLDPEGKGITGTRTGDLTLDGYDENLKLGFEFISTEDIRSWYEQKPHVSVDSYDFMGAAEALSAGLAHVNAGMPVAVFYDPHYEFNKVEDMLPKGMEIYGDREKYESLEESLKELVKEDLRAQVRDFIAWLKAQGII